MNIFNYSYKLQLNLYKDMKNSKFVIDKLTQLVEKGLVSTKDLADEIISILKSKRDEVVFRMKLTSKDEFDVLSKRVENLEKIISQSKQTKKKTKRVRKS
tara:strand:- start:32 stop:331 length:300 start_codon:yes stop_codon:yes gene_type:complete